jgi:hypothetical protein
MHAQPTTVPFYSDRPWAAAHRAVFDQHARGIRVDVEIDPLSTVRAANANGVLHAGILACAGRNITALGPDFAPVPTGMLARAAVAWRTAAVRGRVAGAS